jgi:ATP phosphoribosyltransferase
MKLPTTSPERLRLAIQKSGRLTDKSLAIFTKCGLDFDLRKDRLIHECKNFPIDLMLMRDDDIPEYVADGVCHLGIVGENVAEEKCFSNPNREANAVKVIRRMGFGTCRLSLAIPEGKTFNGIQDFQGLRIATSYPSSLKKYLKSFGVDAKIVELNGSVEIAPGLNIADAICDLVSTGGTLRSNGLKEVQTIFESQAVMIRSASTFSSELTATLDRLLQRVNGVIHASESKYIMMNAPTAALEKIRQIIPGMEEPSIMPLGTTGERIAIHAVARETIFWETIESLKAVGASSILVLPIEKVIA